MKSVKHVLVLNYNRLFFKKYINFKYMCSRDVRNINTHNHPNGLSSTKNKNDSNKELCSASDDLKQVKSFDSIPGPKSLPIIGTLWTYFPFIGEYQFSEIYQNCIKRFKKYGPIVREEILPGVNVVYLFNAEDIQVLLRATGDRPERRSHTMVMKYRKSKPEIYNSGGLLPSNGDEWWKIRSKFQKPLGSPRKAAVYIDATDSIVSEFINKINQDGIWTENKNKTDILNYLSRLYMELICLIAFDIRLHSFSNEEMKPDSFSSELREASINASKNIVQTDAIPEFVSNYFPTKVHTEMVEAQEKLEEIALKLVSQKMAIMKNKVKEDDERKEISLLETYLSDPDFDFKDVIGTCIDFLLGGIDTTTYSTGFALYHLAKNKDVQEKLHKECVELLPNIDDKVTEDVLSKASYLKAVVKESLRLNPVSVGIGRNVLKDIILSGYFIPKGSVAVAVSQVCSKLPEYFENPEEFVPERWIRKSEYPKPLSLFASMPFGHGPRMCIARRLAEQDIYIVLFKLVRQFEVGWNGGDLGIISETLNKPNGPVSVTLKRRN